MSSRISRTETPPPRIWGASWRQWHWIRVGVFPAVLVGAWAVLALSRVLPAEGAGLAIRLTAAFACVVLVPGALILRAIDWPARIGLAVAGSLAWGLMAVLVAMGVTFLANGSPALAIGIVAALAVVALAVSLRRRLPDPVRPARGEALAIAALVAAGVALGAVVWWSSTVIDGDALFHLARVRKLAEAPELTTLGLVNEFRDGSLHPGYAFPLWHGVLALVANLAGVDAAAVVLHMATPLVPLALIVTYSAGAAVFGSRIGGAVTVVATLALVAFPRSGTGSLEFLALPASVGRLLLAPVVVAFAFAFLRQGSRSYLLTVGAAALALAVVHITYAIFLVILLAGFALARFLLPEGRRDARRMGVALGAVLVPTAIVSAALVPLLSETNVIRPGAVERARELANHGESLEIVGSFFSLTADTLTRGPAFVAAFLAVAATIFAPRTRWASYVVGGSLAVLLFLLVPPLFTALADLASLSQARRLSLFLPLAVALGGACIVLGQRTRVLGLVIALALGIVLQLVYPWDEVVVEGGAGAWPVWVAVAAALAALIAAPRLARRPLAATPRALACAVLFALPIGVAGLMDVERDRPDRHALTPGLVEAVDSEVGAGEIVFADLETSYRLAAYTGVYVAAAPPAHVASVGRNRPSQRRLAAVRFFYREGLDDVEKGRILAGAGASWLVVDTTRHVPGYVASLPPPLWEDGRYALYALPGA